MFVFCTGQDGLPPRAVLQAIDPVYQTTALTYPLGEGIRDCVLDAKGWRCYCLAQGMVRVKDLDIRPSTGNQHATRCHSPDRVSGQEADFYLLALKQIRVYL
jgi:hypothetical protein